MQMFTAFLVGAALIVVLILLRSFYGSFRGQRSDDYADLVPMFDIRERLSGPILSEGVIYGPFGRVSSRFVVEMEGTWDGDEGRLVEDFRYDSGQTQHRVWTLRVDGQGNIQAEAPDVIGTGRGRQVGPAVQLRYKIRLPESSGGHILDATDWMYLVENGTIINRSQFRKYGVKVAELVATLRRKDMP